MYIAWLQFGTENYGKEQQSSKITHLFDGERVFSSGELRPSSSRTRPPAPGQARGSLSRLALRDNNVAPTAAAFPVAPPR